jgi:hypothetical protein
VAAPDSTAVRTALWRALHVAVDPPPHVFADEFGLRLADPGDGWRDREDMDPATAGRYRAGMVARAGSSRTSSPSRPAVGWPST